MYYSSDSPPSLITIAIRHPVTIIFIFTIVLPQNVIFGSAAVRLYRWQLNGHFTHGALVG